MFASILIKMLIRLLLLSDVIDKDILNLGRQEAIGEQAAEDDRKRVENEAERNRNVHLEMPRSGKDFISKMRQNGVLWK